MTLTGIQVNKSGNRISMSIDGCQRSSEIETFINSDQPAIIMIRTGNGYEMDVNMNHDEVVGLSVYDLLGRITYRRTISLQQGENKIEIPLRSAGTYIAELKGATFSESRKVVY